MTNFPYMMRVEILFYYCLLIFSFLNKEKRYVVWLFKQPLVILFSNRSLCTIYLLFICIHVFSE